MVCRDVSGYSVVSTFLTSDHPMHPDRSPTWCHKDSAIVWEMQRIYRCQNITDYQFVSFSSRNQTIAYISTLWRLKENLTNLEWFSLGAYIFTAVDYGTDPYCVTCLPCLALPCSFIFSVSCCFPFSPMLLLGMFWPSFSRGRLLRAFDAPISPAFYRFLLICPSAFLLRLPFAESFLNLSNIL